MNSPKPQILCFAESFGSKSTSEEKISLSSIKPKQKASRIVHLEVVSVAGQQQDDVLGSKLLAVYEDGEVSCYSNTLATEEWRRKLDSGSFQRDLPAEFRVELSVVVDIHQARKSLLKSRDDVLATFRDDKEEMDDSLLILLTRSKSRDTAGKNEQLNIRYFNVGAMFSPTDRLTTGPEHKLLESLCMVIPEPSTFRSQKSHFSLHTASGTLYQNAEGLLATYDLNGVTPHLSYQFNISKSQSYSCLRLSSSLVAFSSLNSLSVVNLPYCSLQAERALHVNYEDQRIKQEKQGMNSRFGVRLISYFTSLKLLLALEGRKLIAIQLSDIEMQGRSQKRKRDGLLVDSIDHGSPSLTFNSIGQGTSDGKIKDLGTYISTSAVTDMWDQERALLDRYVVQKDEEMFEREMATTLGLQSKTGGYVLSRTHRPQMHNEKFDYLLNKMFEIQDADEETPVEAPKRLRIRLFPPRLVDWLIQQALLTVNQIELSLKRCHALPTTARLFTGTFIQALAEWDASLHLLSSLLASHTPLGSLELVHVLNVLGSNTNTSEPGENEKLLTNSDVEDAKLGFDKTQCTGVETTESSGSASPTAAHNKCKQHILSMTMKRLYACSSSSIAHALKTGLSTEQLRLLVDTLRMEMARGGWLSPYENALRTPKSDMQDNHQLCFIGHLLNCVIDSIGTGGWIMGTSVSVDLSESADTIAYMKAEISAALEGIEEATYLKGMLGEILLYGKDALLPVKQSRPPDTQLTTTPKKPMTIALQDKGTNNLLPLGLRGAQVIPKTKVGAGGEVLKRSRREIGMLKSKKVPKYSFERIII